MKTSLIIPAYNEEEGLPKVVEEALESAADEVIIIDDGSTDSTFERASKYAKNPAVKILRHGKNRGKPEAIRTGVRNMSGDIVIIMDADFTYPAKHFRELAEKIGKGSELVLGSRFLGLKNEMPFLRMIGNRLASFGASRFSRAKITDPQTGYRAFRKEMFSALDVQARGLEYETKMTVKALKLGLKVSEISIEYRKRAGKSKLGVKDIARMAFSLIYPFSLQHNSREQ